MNTFIGICLGFFLCMFLNAAVRNERDSTDAPGGRSGMRLHTDHATGLQYLSVPGGGITPRLGLDGKQMRADGAE
ncbi:hypothetical protein [Pseudomonas aeruginosa]|uniref:hypothetical protein n=1 Tax=Pseudomonas aeruginosa TaxID=287 RepID=UPI00300C28B2